MQVETVNEQFSFWLTSLYIIGSRLIDLIIYGIYKDSADDLTCRAAKETDILNPVGEGEGGMIWENNTEMYTLPYVKQTASESLMSQGSQSQCSVTT